MAVFCGFIRMESVWYPYGLRLHPFARARGFVGLSQNTSSIGEMPQLAVSALD
jgi:hypothetical protein